MQRLHFSGYTVGALATDLVMPDGEIVFTEALVVGVSAVYNLGALRQRQRLPWPPLTVLVRFDQDLVRHVHNPFGYALALLFDGAVNLVYPVAHEDKVQAKRIETRLRHNLAAHLRNDFAHRMPAFWRASQPAVNAALTRYQQHQLTLPQLIALLQSHLDSLAPEATKPAARIIANAWARARDADQQFAALSQPRFLITNTNDVTNSLYANEAFELTKEMALTTPDPRRAKNAPYREQLFAAYLETQRLLQENGVPLTPPQVGEHYWTPADLQTYMPLGMMSKGEGL